MTDQDSIAGQNTLHDEPVVFIKAGSVWKPINFREFWQYRELLYFLIWRDVKIRYKQTALGIIWAILQPLLAAVIFTIFFGRLVGVPSDGIPYFLFAYAGFLPWTFFANSVTASGNSLVGSSHLITKVYFPRLIIPIAAVCTGLIDFVVAFAILIIMMLWYGTGFSLNFIFFLPIVFLIIGLASGVGILMSALNVKYRDIRFALPFLIQIWMFASPVIYPGSLIPEKWRLLAAINPLTGIIEGMRSSLFGTAFEWKYLGISILVTIIILFISLFVFRRMEKDFADII
ncbi:MAG: ABC transporter permease [Pyrinomonadaceae bacterium]